jgi:hypothetical protein
VLIFIIKYIGGIVESPIRIISVKREGIKAEMFGP